MSPQQKGSEGEIDVADLRPGDVLLYHRANALGRVMCFFDGSDVSHAALYTGEGVAEATGEGVLPRSLENSLGSAPGDYIVVHRWKSTGSADGLAGVLARARYYLGLKLDYGFSTVAQIAVLCLTRRIHLTRKARVLLRMVLDRATSELFKPQSADRPRLICSELVFRCYAEAQSSSAYDIQIAGLTWTESIGEEAAAERQPAPGSLLDQARAHWSQQGAMESMGAADGGEALEGDLEEATDQAIAKAAEDLLEEADLEALPESVPIAEAPELLRSLRRFVEAGGGVLDRNENLEGIFDFDRTLERLGQVVARFVSPGDLRSSASLERRGRLRLNGKSPV